MAEGAPSTGGNGYFCCFANDEMTDAERPRVYNHPRLFVFVWAVVAALPAVVTAQPEASPPRLHVSGTADVRVAPDLAVVRLGVAHEAPTAREAQRQVNAVSVAILAAVEGAGVEERQVQTTQLTLSPIYSSGRGVDEEPRITGYRASSTVSVRVEQLERVAPVIDAALDAGANQLQGVSFGLLDDRAVKQQALRQAIGEARDKADAMAAALGMELDGLVSISEQAGFVQPPMMEMSRAMALQAESSTSVSPGEIAVSASVSLEYRLSEP